MPPAVQSEASAGSSSEGPRGTNGAKDSHADESAASSLGDVSARLAELRAYAGYFLAAKLDRIKLTIRQFVLLAVLGVIGLVAVVGVIITAIVLTLRGIAGGLAEICGNRPWLGDLLCGVLVLAVLAIGLWTAVKGFTRMSRQSTVQKYESDQRTQRADLGADVPRHGAAASAGGTTH
jgi:hypothetical protein